MPQTIAVVSFKGGAGKSTTTAGLASEFALSGRHVLAVDVDPQGGLTAALGVEINGSATTWDWLNRSPLENCIVATDAGVEVVPANMRLAGAELSTSSGWQHRLRDRIEQATGFDVVLFDSAPGLGVLPFMALRAARHALIVCPPDFLSVRVIPHVLAVCERAECQPLGIIPTMVTTRTRHAREALASMVADYGELLLPGIPQRVVVQDAALTGVPVQTYAPDSDAAQAFGLITERITLGPDA